MKRALCITAIATFAAGCGGGGTGGGSAIVGVSHLTFNSSAPAAGTASAQGDATKVRITWPDPTGKQDFFDIVVRAPFTLGTAVPLVLPGGGAYALTRGNYGMYATINQGSGTITITKLGGGIVSGSFVLHMFDVHGNEITATGDFSDIPLNGFGGSTMSK